MNGHNLAHIAAVISHIEAHLHERLDLEAIARAAGYSKYHLHRMFTDAVGLTPRVYIQRRRLTEAARLLVFTANPILEIAWLAGYESQQAFTPVFKSMYKQTPLEYRQNKTFYPLQLAYPISTTPTAVTREIAYAAPDDIPEWMNFVSLVIGGFPCLDESAHRETVKRYIKNRQALVMRDGAAVVGAAAFSVQAGSIDFLAAHPQYRHGGVEKPLLDFITRGQLAGRAVSITTFREGDRADTGQRAAYKRLGFTEAELLTEFGYPTQRMILLPEKERACND